MKQKTPKKTIAIESTLPKYPTFPYTDARLKLALEKIFEDLGIGKENAYFKPFLFDGANVVIKPNLVFHENHSGSEFESLVTHTSIIKNIIDIILESNPHVNITILDVPLQSADWESLVKKSKLDKLVSYYKKERNISIQLFDARKERVVTDEYGVVLKRIQHNGDPKGYCAVQINKESEHLPIQNQYKRFAVTDYNLKEMSTHHNTKTHEYLISKTVLESDLFINLPKLKSHRKGGLTVSLKNLIGINASKDWLPHHRKGPLDEGGDEFPKGTAKQKTYSAIMQFVRLRTPLIYRYLAKTYYFLHRKKPTKQSYNEENVKEGSWFGNDTLWRTILDINKIILYADKNGKMQKTKQRTYFSLVDGIIAMEGEGPLAGTSKKTGILVGGFEASSVDLICARLMGFDEKKIPQLSHLKEMKREIGARSIKEITIKSTNQHWQQLKTHPDKVSLHFIPSSGWMGHIEWEK